ncbi:MAG: nitrogenase component 1 [archaeon]|nr:nitrogenase component 1 [archaeon]
MNRPDGFVGAVMAIEGVVDATAMLHGQNGCRKGLLLSRRMCPRPERDVDLPVYDGVSVVPFSGINQGDYTGRSMGKLVRALDLVSREDYRFIALLCSPGISIVGDDCARALGDCGPRIPSMVIDSSELGEEVWVGFDRAIRSTLEKITSEGKTVRPGTVVVTGLSIMHKDWRTFEEELCDILGDMGLEVICFAGAGCTVDQLIDSVNTEWCIDISPEYSVATRSYYAERGVEVVSAEESPVGFDATESFYRRIAESTGRDCSPALERLRRFRRRAYDCIRATGRDLRGRTFHVSAPESVRAPLTRFLVKSFSMLESDMDYDYLFAEGDRCVTEKASGGCQRCIDVGFPSRKVDFGMNPVLGLHGTMYLLDSLFL